jgi:dihydroneopterin triphosphate diphosphatase
MARAPFQVLVYPYRQMSDDEYQYALLKRSDAGWWQGIAGGGEDDEMPLDAARREAREEAGITSESHFLKLDTIVWVRVTEFRDIYLWRDDLFVIPQHCFGVLVSDESIVLSGEHSEYRWLDYDEADKHTRYDGNKTALWELNQRLKGKGPRG